MPLYPRRRNVAAQVAVELKPVTCATHPMEERRKKEEKEKTDKTERVNAKTPPRHCNTGLFITTELVCAPIKM